MEITTRQLNAIEDAIGRNAEVKVTLEGDWYGYRGDFRHSGGTRIEVTAGHKGRKVYTRLAFDPYRDIPMAHIARQLVMDINRHIMNEEFAGVFKG